MIVFTTERCKEGCVAHLDGSFEASDDPIELAHHLVTASGTSPLVVDLGDVDPPDGPKMAMLVRCLAMTPKRHTTVLVHPDLEVRRHLRAGAQGLPVVPSNELVLEGRFASALVADEPSTEPR